MSLQRTALRLAACRALLADPVVAAICEDRVYDSRMAPLAVEPKPTVIVTTETNTGTPWNDQNGGPPFEEVCQFTLEIAVKGLEFDDAGNALESVSITDKEIEAKLDLLEDRVPWILGLSLSPEARLVRKVLRRIARKESERFISEDTGEKLAVRLVSLTCELIGESPRNPLDAPTGDYAALPDPLRTVCEAMPAGSSGEDVCKLIAAALPVLTPRPLKTVRFTSEVGAPVPGTMPPNTEFPLGD